MKKIAFLLALALALTSCLLVLAACNEDEADTSSEAGAASTETSSTTETSSKTETSSTATSSEDTSSVEESSEEPGFEKNPNAIPNESGENLALGATYEKSQLYRQGGADTDWGWDPEKDVTYDDTNDEELTDGVIAAFDEELNITKDEDGNPVLDDDGNVQTANRQYSGEAWMGFHAKAPDYVENGYSWFTVDLGEIYEISKLVTYVGTKSLGGGIYVPASVEYLVSDDNEEFVSVGKVVPVDVTSAEAEPETVASAATLEDLDVTGRYVQVRMVCAGWMFVTEFEAY